MFNNNLLNEDLIKSLTPISEIALMGDIKDKFHYKEAQKYLKKQGKDINNFYFNRSNHLAWFCYYKDFVLLDLFAFTEKGLKAVRISELIDLETGRLNACIENGDYKSFFYLVDKRIALYAYNRLFHQIPDAEKYKLFWLIYTRCEYSLYDFTPAYITNIINYRAESLDIPGTDREGFIEIFRGETHGSMQINKACSWTVDINTAVYYATCYGKPGKVFKGIIHKDKVLAYIRRRNEKEIVAYPYDIKKIEEVNLLSLKDIKPGLIRRGILNEYASYRKLMRKEYFYRPDGIHGIFHTQRVLLLALILADYYRLTPEDSYLLCIAALYHDIGRTNDNFDPKHGLESWKKVQKLGLVNGQKEEDKEILRYIIENHCVDDKTARTNLAEYNLATERAERLFTLFKDADGLDRIRINDLDINHLRTGYAKCLLLVARELMSEV